MKKLKKVELEIEIVYKGKDIQKIVVHKISMRDKGARLRQKN